MSYAVAINSAGRPGTIVETTLPMLRDGGVPMDVVTVWVASDADADVYRSHLDLGGYRDVSIDIAPHDPMDDGLDRIGVEPANLGRARNFVMAQLQPGEQLLSVDDDVPSIMRATSPKDIERVADVDRVIRTGFRDADAAATTLWGVYPVDNPYFMRPKMRLGLSYIIGSFYGIIATGGRHEPVTVDDGEDYERSIRHYLASGNVLRYEYLCSGGATGYTGDGGMQLTRSKRRVAESKRWIARAYPDLATINTGKRSGWVELRLRDRRVGSSA